MSNRDHRLLAEATLEQIADELELRPIAFVFAACDDKPQAVPAVFSVVGTPKRIVQLCEQIIGAMEAADDT